MLVGGLGLQPLINDGVASGNDIDSPITGAEMGQCDSVGLVLHDVHWIYGKKCLGWGSKPF